MILKPHALTPLVGLVLGQNLLNANLGGALGIGIGIQGVSAAPAPGAADTPAPPGWVYNGCLTGFPSSDSWITYAPAGTGAMTDALCAASCRPYRRELVTQIYAVVHSRPAGADYCLCTTAVAEALTTEGCFAECATGVQGACAAPGMAIVYSVGPASDQVRWHVLFVVGVFDVKLCHVCNEIGEGGGLSGRLGGVGRRGMGGGSGGCVGNGNRFVVRSTGFGVLCAMLCMCKNRIGYCLSPRGP